MNLRTRGGGGQKIRNVCGRPKWKPPKVDFLFRLFFDLIESCKIGDSKSVIYGKRIDSFYLQGIYSFQVNHYAKFTNFGNRPSTSLCVCAYANQNQKGDFPLLLHGVLELSVG